MGMLNDKQRVRNILSMIEDEARANRNKQQIIDGKGDDMHSAFHLIATLAKLVREDIVQ